MGSDSSKSSNSTPTTNNTTTIDSTKKNETTNNATTNNTTANDAPKNMASINDFANMMQQIRFSTENNATNNVASTNNLTNNVMANSAAKTKDSSKRHSKQDIRKKKGKRDLIRKVEARGNIQRQNTMENHRENNGLTRQYSMKNFPIKKSTTKKGKDRLVEELDKLMNDPDINNCFGVDYWDPDAPNPDVFHWQITLVPPQGTDYEGGFFKLEAKFSEEYPLYAPKMKFLTKIYHCNVDELGNICLNTLKKNWKQSFTMEDVLNHIIILLYKQNPDSALNGSAATLYKKDKSKFKEEVKKYVKDYANIKDYEDMKKQNISLLK